MRCALLPCNIDVRLNPNKVNFHDWSNGVLYYFCLPNGSQYEIGVKLNDLGNPVDCSYCRLTYSRGYDDPLKSFMALKEITWLKLPVIIREKIWQTLTGQERCFEYDEDEANFVYYGESEDFIWATLHCIHSVDMTLKITDKLGQRFIKYRRINYKEIYSLSLPVGKETQYLIDDKNIVIIREVSGRSSLKIKSLKDFNEEKKNREQLVEYLSHTLEIPVKIASLISLKTTNKESAVKFFGTIIAYKSEFSERLKATGAHRISSYSSNIKDLLDVLGRDLFKGFTLEGLGEPFELINYLVS